MGESYSMDGPQQVTFIPIWAEPAYYAFAAAYSFIFSDQWVFRVTYGAAYALPLIVTKHSASVLTVLALCHHPSVLNFIFFVSTCPLLPNSAQVL